MHVDAHPEVSGRDVLMPMLPSGTRARGPLAVCARENTACQMCPQRAETMQ